MEFSDFLLHKQHIPEKRVPYYLRWVTLYHEHCRRKGLQVHLSESVTSFAADLAKDHEDWQVLQGKEAVRFFIYFEEKRRKQTSAADGAEEHETAPSVSHNGAKGLQAGPWQNRDCKAGLCSYPQAQFCHSPD